MLNNVFVKTATMAFVFFVLSKFLEKYLNPIGIDIFTTAATIPTLLRSTVFKMGKDRDEPITPIRPFVSNSVSLHF